MKIPILGEMMENRKEKKELEEEERRMKEDWERERKIDKQIKNIQGSIENVDEGITAVDESIDILKEQFKKTYRELGNIKELDNLSEDIADMEALQDKLRRMKVHIQIMKAKVLAADKTILASSRIARALGDLNNITQSMAIREEDLRNISVVVPRIEVAFKRATKLIDEIVSRTVPRGTGIKHKERAKQIKDKLIAEVKAEEEAELQTRKIGEKIYGREREKEKE